ncbi:MAG: hypothetical protein ACKOBN_06815 [Flavobacteriales bacterium]
MHKIVLFSFLCGFFTACRVEVATPEVNHELRIVSNFLTPKQQLYFKDWQKKSGIKIEFLRLNIQQIRSRIKNYPWNPGFDLVWLNGLEAYSQLEGTPFQERHPDFAQIPVGLSYVPDSLEQVQDFIKLSKTNLWAAADEESYTILKAHIAFAFRKRDQDQKLQKAYLTILRGLKERKLAFNGADTYHTNMLLSRYDTYYQQLKPANRQQRIIFPRFFKYAGVADRNIICFVKQAINFSSAKRFEAYLRKQMQKNQNFFKMLGFKKIDSSAKLIPSSTLLSYLKK